MYPKMEERPLRYGFLSDVKSRYLAVTLPKNIAIDFGISLEDLVKNVLSDH